LELDAHRAIEAQRNTSPTLSDFAALLGKVMFDDFLALPANAPGKRALVESLRSLYGSINALNEAMTCWT